jgi:membrane-associated phospholipid phosphatase
VRVLTAALRLDRRGVYVANLAARRSGAATYIGAAARGLAGVEVFLMLVLAVRGRRGASAGMLVAVAVVYAAAEALGRLAPRARPFESVPGVSALAAHTPGRSFPSRHVASGLAMACVVADEHRLGGLMTAVAWALGGARVLAGLHYPSDVLGGAGLGLGVAYCVRSVGTHYSRSYKGSRR